MEWEARRLCGIRDHVTVSAVGWPEFVPFRCCAPSVGEKSKPRVALVFRVQKYRGTPWMGAWAHYQL